jgi:hypothetical protein
VSDEGVGWLAHPAMVSAMAIEARFLWPKNIVVVEDESKQYGDFIAK